MPPKNPVGNRGKPQGSDPDANPRVAETSAPPPPPDMRHGPSSVVSSPPPKNPVGNRGKPQGSDPDAHRVAETSAPPPPPDAPPPSELPSRKSGIVRIRLPPHLRRPKGSGVVAQPRRSETLAPPPSAATRTPSTETLDLPPSSSAVATSSGALLPSATTRTPSTLSLPQRARSTRLQASSDQAQDLKSSGGPPGVAILGNKGISDAKDTSKLEELDWKAADWMLAKGCVEKNQNQVTSLELPEALEESEKKRSSFLKAELATGGLPSTTATLKTVALVSDQDMLLHKPPGPKSDQGMLLDKPPGPEFEEVPARLTKIMSKLKEDNLFERCDLFKPDEIARSYLLSVHCKDHVEEVEALVTKTQRQREIMARKHDSIYFCKNSTRAALLAAGGSIKACALVVEGLYNSSFALVRPPGHHAGPTGPSGFCIFNNAAVAANYVLEKYQKEKVLIVDWDVHHGNGTQETFYNDNRVLFISLHRQEGFYPFSKLGNSDRIGVGNGKGFNVNLGWNHGGIRDADYMYAWDNVVLPIAEEFKPDIIIISAGFDAAKGDVLGGCEMTPAGYATLLDKLMKLGPTVMVLEGGYCLDSLPDCVSACVKVLLGDRSHIHSEMKCLPYETTVQMVDEVRGNLYPFWESLRNGIPQEISSRCIPVPEDLQRPL